jgi:transposase
VLIIGTPERFGSGKAIASYLGLVPSEESSEDRRRLGHITRQGNSLLRFLLVDAAQVTVRSDPEWRSKFFRLALRRGRKIAKVAMAQERFSCSEDRVETCQVCQWTRKAES